MNKQNVKEIMRKQNNLFEQAVEDKLEHLLKGDDFNEDIFEQVIIEKEDDDEEIFSQKERLMKDLDVVYSHRVEGLSEELPENRVASYQQRVATLRGIGMVDDYNSTYNKNL